MLLVNEAMCPSIDNDFLLCMIYLLYLYLVVMPRSASGQVHHDQKQGNQIVPINISQKLTKNILDFGPPVIRAIYEEALNIDKKQHTLDKVKQRELMCDLDSGLSEGLGNMGMGKLHSILLG